ncbi:MAG: YitT family protein [Sphaerochaeta sp.]|uniref:YitT family protein n=2 Tax=unclassified Sphaerochaeta TaxID=2637943 RepID=UPI003D0C1EE8
MTDINHKRLVLEALYLVGGTALAGFAIAVFITPAKIASGGVNGVATIIYHLTGWDTGFVMLCISVPLFLVGMSIFGKTYGVRSLAGTLFLSIWVSLFGQLTDYNGFLPYIDRMDTLLSAIFGGVLLGSGIGIVMRSGANTGGTDILAQILARYTPLPLGTALFLCDTSVIVFGAMVFGLERALFAVITLYLSGQMVNFVVMNLGTKYAKTAYIVSEHHEAIGKRIITELHHGGTLISGVGIFTGRERTILLAVVHNQQINHLTQIVHQEDPKAFMFVHETYQALGEGFVPMQNLIKLEEKRSKQNSPNR